MTDSSEDSRPVPTQTFNGPVGNVTGSGDIIHYHSGAVQLIQVLERAIAMAPQIPDPEKKSLLERLRSFADNPYVSGLASSAIFEGVKGLVEQLNK